MPVERRQENSLVFKTLLLGSSGVGKTSILNVISVNPFEQCFVATIGVDFKVHSFDIDGKVVKLQIWDTAGQERFRSLTPHYYKNAKGIVLIYDITCRDSFNEVLKNIETVKMYLPDMPKCILLGNKQDLEEKRAVSFDEGNALANEFGFVFMEVSAKTSFHTIDAFKSLTKEMKEKEEKDGNQELAMQGRQGEEIPLKPAESKFHGCCS